MKQKFKKWLKDINPVTEAKDIIKKKGIGTYLLSILIILIIICMGIALVFGLYVIINAPEFDKDKLYRKEASVIYDINGNEIARIGTENIELMTYDDLPQVFIDALVATEDSRFFQHNGVDVARFIKASIYQIIGKNYGGASTVSMQVIKKTYTSSEASGIKGIIRKFTDIYMAVFKLENSYTKEEILEFYTNTMWFGNDGNINYSGIVGVERASQYYFGKSVKDLNLAEASILVGMYQNPVAYNPYRFPDNCRKRQTTVLKLMVQHNYISEDEMNAILDIPLQSLVKAQENASTESNENQEVIDYIIDEVIDKTGIDPRYNSMQIYSTIDPNIQSVMTRMENGEFFTFKVNSTDALEEGATKLLLDQVGAAVTSVEDGSVKAIYGGRDYQARGLNRATDISRQPGSTAKLLFDYGPQIEYMNASTAEYYFDEPYSYSTGQALYDADKKWQGLITMREAVVGSRNVPALQSFQKLYAENPDYISEYVGKMNIHYGDNLYESYSIGGFNGMSPLELAAAYGTYARGGYYIEPYVFTKIVYDDGTEYNYKLTKTKVCSEETAYMVTSMLISAVQEGWSGYNINVYGTQVAGKTGTTNVSAADVKNMGLANDIIPDSWTVSYTPEYVISLWYGYDELNKYYYMNSTEGWRARSYLMGGLANNIYSTNKTFTKPAGVVEVTVEKYTYPTLQLPSEYTPDYMKMTELFKEGTEPTEVSTRYAKLDKPTNLQKTIKDNVVTLTWDAIETPKSIDKDYLQNYFNKYYGDYATQYYEKRINENNEQFGSLQYRIYLEYENDAGETTLEYLKSVDDTTFSYKIDPTESYTFVVKTCYQKFDSNQSSGVKISVDATKKKTDKTDKTDENTNTTTN